MVTHHELLGDLIHHNQFDGIRRAVLDAQLTARAFGRIIDQLAAQVFGSGFTLERIQFRDRAFEERSKDITKHCTNSHSNPSLEKRANLAADDDGQHLQQAEQCTDAPPHAHGLIDTQAGKQGL